MSCNLKSSFRTNTPTGLTRSNLSFCFPLSQSQTTAAEIKGKSSCWSQRWVINVIKMELLDFMRVIAERSETGHHLCFNIFKLCHCVQTLTETLCPFRSSVTQRRLAPLIVYLETKRGPHVCTYSSISHVHTYTTLRFLSWDQVFMVYMNMRAIVGGTCVHRLYLTDPRSGNVLLMGVFNDENV